jgi:phage gpG-like protein
MGLVINVDITDNTREITEELKKKVEEWLEAVGEDAATTATGISEFPVDTGRLRNSITAATAKFQSNPNGYEGDSAESGDFAVLNQPEEDAVYIGTNVEYAPYHEFGTSRGIPAKHFLQYGMTAHKSEYKQLLEEKLKQ